MLDAGRFEEWLELLHPSISYVAPARVTAMKADDEARLRTIDHFAEDHHALRKRVASWWLPDEIIRLPTMPLAPTGKIDKLRLRAELGRAMAS